MALRSGIRLFALFLLFTSFAHAFTIQLDYSNDAANGNFFGQNAAAKAAVDAAAADLNALFAHTLNAVTTDVYSGTSGSTTATFNWNLSYTNPSTGATVTLDTFSFPADTLTIYVGVQKLAGSTLGQGGPGGAGYSLSGSGFSNEWTGAVSAAESASNTAMLRGGGPVMGSISGSSTFDTTTANFTLKYGVMLGNLWFDDDTNNDDIVDSNSTMANYWNYDYSGAVPTGKFDLYSVALHEIIHALGAGTSDTWDSLVSGSNWLGINVITANHGSGANLISGDHFAEGTMSTRISDGLAQEVVMDPSISSGTRKSLTELDVAMLKDLGYLVVPEPGSAGLIFSGFALAAFRRRRGAV